MPGGIFSVFPARGPAAAPGPVVQARWLGYTAAMSVFTPLKPRELAAVLRRWELTLVDYKAATEGIENSNFLIEATDPGGHIRPVVLTLFERTHYHELPPLVTLLSHLAAAGLPVPEPLANSDGKRLQVVADKPAVLVPRLPGRHPDTPDPGLCRALGAMLARLHTAGVEPAGLAGAEQLDRLSAGAPPDRAVTEVLAAWGEIREQLPGGLIHGDLFRDNVLVADGRITGLLDFYSAGPGAFLFDLAVCLNDWAGPDRPELAEALLAGYESVRSLTDAEREALPLALAAAALRFWLSRLEAEAREQQGEGQVSKDPGEFEVLFRRRFEGWKGP